MMQFRAILALFVLLAGTGLSVAEIPNLVGNWTGTMAGYTEGLGYIELNASEAIKFVVSEQRDRLFTGQFIVKLQNGSERMEAFSGSIGLDNKTLYIAEYDQGYDMGTIISKDEIELSYLEDGEVAKMAIDRFRRAGN